MLPLNERRLSSAFWVLSSFTYVLLILGATVRVHGAGLSCPDWPLCFGEVVPQFDLQIFLEWFHRQIAGIISLGFLGLGGWVLYTPALRAKAGRLVLAAAGVLTLQIILGGLTVLHLLAYWSVTLHLLCGNLFTVLLVLIGYRLRGTPQPVPAQRGLMGAGLALGALVVCQLSLGGLVSSNYAGLACTEWPTCNAGQWFPTWQGPVGLQLMHRLAAYTLAVVAVGFAVVARRSSALRIPSLVVACLVGVQIVLGVTNILLRMPVEIAILHSAVADAIVLGTAVSLYRLIAGYQHAEIRPSPPLPLTPLEQA